MSLDKQDARWALIYMQEIEKRQGWVLFCEAMVLFTIRKHIKVLCRLYVLQCQRSNGYHTKLHCIALCFQLHKYVSFCNQGWGKLRRFHCFRIKWHKSCCSETTLQMLGCDTSFPQLLKEAREDLLGYVSRLGLELVVFQDGAPSLLHGLNTPTSRGSNTWVVLGGKQNRWIPKVHAPTLPVTSVC